MKLTMRTKGRHVNVDKELKKNVCESCLVFLHNTARIKENPAHSKNTLMDLKCYRKSWDEELDKLANNLCEKIKHYQFETHADTNFIKKFTLKFNRQQVHNT